MLFTRDLKVIPCGPSMDSLPTVWHKTYRTSRAALEICGWGSKVRGSGGWKSFSGVQGRSPSRGSGEAEAVSEKYVSIFIKNNCKIVFN